MKNLKKKGFTIVELVIVIAVVAILAAVLIPTFVNLTKRANRSVDIQAVVNMNKLLATENCETILEATELFDANGFDLKNYKPLSKDHYFYYVNGKIILADSENKVIFPEDVNVDGQWMSLSGEVPMEAYTISGTNATINNGAQLAQLMSDYSEGSVSGDLVITLPAGEFDLKGTAETFGSVNGNITLEGAVDAQGNPLTTISGIRSEENTFVSEYQGKPREYGYSIFGKVESGKTVTVKNVIISDVIINCDDSNANTPGHAGIIAGSVYGNLEVENVVIDNCVVKGVSQKGGIVAGFIQGSGASITLEKVKATNCIVKADYFAAGAIGYVDNTNKELITINDCDFSGVTVMLNEDDAAYESAGWVLAVDGNNKYRLVGNRAYALTTNEYYWRGNFADHSIEFDGVTYETYKPLSVTSGGDQE